MSTAAKAPRMAKKDRIPTSPPTTPPGGEQAPGTFRDEPKLPWQIKSYDFAAELAKIYKGLVSEGAAMFQPLEPLNRRRDRVIHTVSSQVAKELFRLSMECKELALRTALPKTRPEMAAWEHQRKHLMSLSETATRLFWVEVEAEMNHRQKPEDMHLCEGWKVVVREERTASPGSFLELLLGGSTGMPISLEELLVGGLEREPEPETLHGNGKGTNGHAG